MNPV
jgi:hypothetical protein